MRSVSAIFVLCFLMIESGFWIVFFSVVAVGRFHTPRARFSHFCSHIVWKWSPLPWTSFFAVFCHSIMNICALIIICVRDNQQSRSSSAHREAAAICIRRWRRGGRNYWLSCDFRPDYYIGMTKKASCHTWKRATLIWLYFSEICADTGGYRYYIIFIVVVVLGYMNRENGWK